MREVMDELLSGGCVEGAVYEEAVSSVESVRSCSAGTA